MVSQIFFVEHAEKVLRLICMKKVSVMKDDNLKIHCQNDHDIYHSITG